MRTRKHERLYAELLARAEALPDGCAFPSTREVMAEYGVSQFTVARALEKLRAQGLVRATVGSGTVVSHGRHGTKRRLALLTPDWDSFAVREFDAALAAEAAGRGWTTETVRYPAAKGFWDELAKPRPCDGMVLEPLAFDGLTVAQLDRLVNAPVPVVVCRAAIPVRGVRYVDGNQQMAGVAAANLCARLGHRDVALLWSEPHNAPMRRVVAGFRTAADSLGLRTTLLDCATPQGEDALASTRRFLRGFLRGRASLPFSAMFVVSDETAVAALEVLGKAGVQVPGDLGVVGYGNVAVGGRYAGRLASVGHECRDFAARALDILAAALRDDRTVPEQVELEPTAFLRPTLGPAPGTAARDAVAY